MKKRYLRSVNSETRMMEDKDGKCLYQRLPKKKLQDLCKGYGLSPYANKANLVDLLFAYFKASGFSAHQILNNESLIIESVKIMESNGPNVRERVPLIKKRRKSRSVSENNKENGDCIIECSKFICEENNAASIRKAEANVSSPIEISPSKDIVPSFHFSVSCDEGINLVVDLNSNPNDWAKRLGNATHCCHPTQNKISGSFRAEVELIGNSNKVKDEFPRNSNFDVGDLCEDKERLSLQLAALSTTTTIVSHDLSEDKVLQMAYDDTKSHPQNGVKTLRESSINAPSETKSSSEVVDSIGDAQLARYLKI